MGVKLSDLSSFESPLKTEGIWLEYEDSGAEFLIASSDSYPYQTKLGKLWGKARRRNQRKDFGDPEVFNPVMFRAIYGTVVKDWRGLDGEDGQPLPFTEENLFELLTKHIGVRQFVIRESGDASNFVEDESGEEPSKEALKRRAPVAA
jgi:hypothetical protein